MTTDISPESKSDVKFHYLALSQARILSRSGPAAEPSDYPDQQLISVSDLGLGKMAAGVVSGSILEVVPTNTPAAPNPMDSDEYAFRLLSDLSVYSIEVGRTSDGVKRLVRVRTPGVGYDDLDLLPDDVTTDRVAYASTVREAICLSWVAKARAIRRVTPQELIDASAESGFESESTTEGLPSV